MSLAYTVIAMFADERTRDEYVAWLEDGHVDAVIAAGAHSAAIVRLDRERAGDAIVIEVRYVFSTREVLEKYLKEAAPSLRAEGLKRFPPERGVALSRTTGTIL
jgi:hypothetical protein